MKYELFIDLGCLVIKDETGFEYDPRLSYTEERWWLNHMREKTWFTRELEDQVIKFLGKKVEDWDEWRCPLPRGSESKEDGDINSMKDLMNKWKESLEPSNR